MLVCGSNNHGLSRTGFARPLAGTSGALRAATLRKQSFLRRISARPDLGFAERERGMSVLACGSERGAGAHDFRKVAVDDAVVLGFDDVVEKVVSLKNARLMGDAVVALKQEGERVLQGLGERRADRGGVEAVIPFRHNARTSKSDCVAHRSMKYRNYGPYRRR